MDIIDPYEYFTIDSMDPYESFTIDTVDLYESFTIDTIDPGESTVLFQSFCISANKLFLPLHFLRYRAHLGSTG